MQTDLQNDALLHLDLRLATSPGITFISPDGPARSIPSMQGTAANGFALELDALLSYASLSAVLRTFLQGKRLELTEGFISQHIIIVDCNVGSGGNDLIAEVPFSGSFTGTLYLQGTPFYNTASQHVELQNVTYDLKTKSLLLKGVKWIFGKLILDEIKKFTSVNVSRFYDMITIRLNELLNKQWGQGIQATGTTETITIMGIQAQQTQLLIRTYCSGKLQLQVSEQVFNF